MTIHIGHRHVHQDDVVVLTLHCRQDVVSIRSEVGAVAKAREHLQRDFLVHEVVLREQHTLRLRVNEICRRSGERVRHGRVALPRIKLREGVEKLGGLHGLGQARGEKFLIAGNVPPCRPT